MNGELRADLQHLLGEHGLPPEAWPALDAELAVADSDSAVVAALRTLAGIIRERDQDLRWHQAELEQTNAGLLALHAEIEQQRQQTAFLDEVSRASAVSLNRRQVLDEVAELLVSHGFADWTTVWTTMDHGLACNADPRREPDETTRTAARSRESIREGGWRVSVPLTVGPQVLGVLDLYRDSSQFTADDITLAKGIAYRAATGLRNASAYEREHELAERLQRAMLPTLASHQELDIVARYRSPTSGVHVGGDWYDAVKRPDGSVVLTVGDVTGHGVDAAVVMGKLQNTLRAYAMEGHTPATSLRLVHEMLRHSEIPLFATAVMAEVDPNTGVMRWASAGHPPPLLQTSSGAVEYLDAQHAPMLGIHVRPGTTIPQHEKKLTPGSSVVLFTDGLVERRTSDLDEGMNRLVEAFRSCEVEGLEGQAEHVLHFMLGADHHDDDVCLLMCRWAGQG